MKIRICEYSYCPVQEKDIPNRVLREFDGRQCSEIIKFRDEQGHIHIGLKTSRKSWDYVAEETEYRELPDGSQELILKYIVTDKKKQLTETPELEEGWEGKPGAQMGDSDYVGRKDDK